MYKLWLLLGLLTACRLNPPTLDSQLQPWIGHSAQNLLTIWGPPNHTYNIDEQTQVFTYVMRSKHGSSHPYPQQFAYNVVDYNYGGTNPNFRPIYYCRISFVILDNVVSNYNFNGDDCNSQILGGN